jgi:hypothetical protein
MIWIAEFLSHFIKKRIIRKIRSIAYLKASIPKKQTMFFIFVHIFLWSVPPKVKLSAAFSYCSN